MTDRELLERAARAAGKKVHWDELTQVTWCGTTWERWDPREDDGEALRLAVQLGIEIHPDREVREVHTAFCVHRPHLVGMNITEPFGNDEMAATRLAIVRAAAAMADQPAEFTPQEMFAPGAEGCFQDAEGTIPVTAIGQPVGRISSSLPEKLERLFQDSAMPIGQRVNFVQQRPENMPTFATKPKEER